MDLSSSFGKASDFEAASSGGVQVTTFTELVDEMTSTFRSFASPNSSAKLGNLYAAAPTRPNNTVSVTSILGRASDNTGPGIARRLVLKTGLNIIVACNIPKNNPILEANAERS